ncbi:MAG: gamma-glutamyl-gamma-aminobutyrate hydrolase family protein, partial [Nitrospinota bacterium]|nr:gamma-glutamyl-gamma-aminobutyrate hydrolase family protein [Nitrospinota bacterium]
VSEAQGYKETRDAISQEWVPYLQNLGYCPILIPNLVDDVDAYARQMNIEALLLTGGNDISPEAYGGNQGITSGDGPSTARDRTEFRLLEYARQEKIPVLGTCRGMQLINTFCGGRLIQNICQKVGGAVNHIAHNHPIKITHPGFVDFLKQEKFTVNSFHSQGVTPATLGNELKPFAISEEDGLLEGLFHTTLPWMGIQWHPERETPSRENDQKIIRAWFANELQL